MSLYPYQWDGVEFLESRERAYLADEMGLGKTVQAIVAARRVGAKNILVVAPASVIPNWRAEWATWWPYRVGGPRVPHISYSKLIQPRWRKRLEAYAPDLVILDEAHYCKTPTAKRTQAALGLASKAQRSWLLSGTPMPNNPMELWAPVKYLWPEIAKRQGCKTKLQWMNRFTHWSDTQYGPRVYATKNAEVLKGELRTFMLRRRVRDVLPDLPPLRVHVHHLESNEYFLEMLSDYEGIDTWEELMEYLDTEHISTLRRLLGEYKAPLVADLIKLELEDRAYEKIVILAHHLDTIALLRKELEEYKPVGFTGGSPTVAREWAIHAFQTDPRRRVFLAQQTAAGVGINLQAASEIVLVEPSWSPEDNRQAIKRVHRIGQDSPCRARLFAVSGTLDEALMEILAQKTQMIQEVVGCDTE